MKQFEGLYVPKTDVSEASMQNHYCALVIRDCVPTDCAGCIYSPNNLEAFKTWYKRERLIPRNFKEQLDAILHPICNFMGVKPHAVRSDSRLKVLADTRHLFLIIADEALPESISRDKMTAHVNVHRSIWYHAKRRTSQDYSFAKLINEYKKELNKNEQVRTNK